MEKAWVETVWPAILSQAWGLALGATASLLGTYFYARGRRWLRWKAYRSLCGCWIEANSLLDDRPFSVCEFYLAKGGELRFAGHSYNNDAKRYYKWSSVSLHIDDDRRRISYVYATHRVDGRGGGNDEGFGCMDLRRDAPTGAWTIESGYFLDLKEAVPRYTAMVRFEDVAKALKKDLHPFQEADRVSLIKLLIANKAAPVVRNLFNWGTPPAPGP